MATQFANGKIVTDGLVLCLDAADINSYPTTGTTWFDLAGSNNGTLTNGPTFSSDGGGSIIFDGVDDNLQTNFRPNFSYSDNQDFSLEIWFYLNLSSYSISLTAMRNRGSGWVWAARSLSNSIYFSWWGGNSWTDLNSSETQKITPGRWNLGNLVYRSVTNNLDFYLNGILIGNLLAGTIFVAEDDITIPRWDDNGAGYQNPQTFSKYSVYNRALTASEVFQNYNVQKRRFGIS